MKVTGIVRRVDDLVCRSGAGKDRKYTAAYPGNTEAFKTGQLRFPGTGGKGV